MLGRPERFRRHLITIYKFTFMAKEEVQDGTGINAAKLKALQATIDKIEKDYGKGTIMVGRSAKMGGFGNPERFHCA